MDEMTRPAAGVAAVTPSDTVDLAKVNNQFPRSLYVGGAGNVVVVTPSGTSATFAGVAAGAILPVQARRVNSTNTTATSIVALY
jgi:hypothetical protein